MVDPKQSRHISKMLGVKDHVLKHTSAWIVK